MGLSQQQQALDAFLKSVQNRAFYHARVATKNVDDALDLVQEAMLTLAKNYGNKPSDEWPPLFHRILQNKILDWHRRRKVRHLVWVQPAPSQLDLEADDEAFLPEAVEEANPAKAFENVQLRDVLMRQVQALPLKQQQTFLLRQWWGYDVKEVAKILGCSEGSVKTHFFRAMEKLKMNAQLNQLREVSGCETQA